MVINMQICVLSDLITLGNRELLFRSHNAVELRRDQPVRFDRQAAFKSSTFWYVKAGKGLMSSRTVFLNLCETAAR